MTADARSLDAELDLAAALAHLAAVAGSATPETRQALAVVLPLVTELQDAALPAVDLDALESPFGGWRYGTGHGYPLGPAVIASPEPDDDGDTLYFRRVGWDRESLPELAALIMAVHAASDPAELEKRYACDCFPDDPADPVHEPWCATNDRPVTS